jgi:hypothetical protein
LPVDTRPLSDTEILYLLQTLAPGVPPGLDQPPLPPDTLTPPPWAATSRAVHLGPWIALIGGLGILILWGLRAGAATRLPPPGWLPI